MIISKTPFRVSFLGGGSDVEWFYESVDTGGAVISTTIQKYMYIVVHPYFNKHYIRLKYSEVEDVDHIKYIQHPIIKACLSKMNMGPGLEIASISDVPAGTGLSSSSAFTVGLLHALYRYNLQSINPRQLAEEACNIEIHTLNSPIGKQDQYAASFGGFNVFRFQKGKKVEVIPLKLSSSTRQNLKQHLRLYFLGSTRSTNTLLKRQNSLKNRKKKVILLKKMVEQVDILRKDLESNETNTIGPLLHETWIRKKELDQSISNSTIDEIYNKALSYGASGGKLLGAGGGGFFLLVHNDHDYLEKKLGLKTLTFDFDLKGSQLTNF